jgi:MFS transporter, DHA1 family, multidrug resistance protein
VLGRAIIRDVYDREAAARGLALVMMVMTLAPAASPTLGAYLAEWVDWRAIFILLGAAGAAVFVTVVVRLGETNQHRIRLNLAGMAGAYAALLRSPAFLALAVCSACTSASWFTFIAAAPHLLSHALDQPPSTYGLMILFPMATYMIGNAVAVRFAQRIGSLRLLLAGRIIAFIGGLALAIWGGIGALSVWVVFLPIALAEIGDGMTHPAAMAAALSIEPRLAGTASGLMGFLQMTAAALGSFVVALLPNHNALGLIAVFGGLVALSLAGAILAQGYSARAARAILPVAAPAAAAEGT